LGDKGGIGMTRLGMTFIATFLIVSTPHEGKFNRLSAVETYQIRPGILMMPSYSDAGEVCQIVLERRHVSSKKIDLDAEMSREEIYRIFDELVPKPERGQPKLKLGDNGSISMVDGHTIATVALYENVSIRMYGTSKNAGPKGYVAATIDWDKRNCKDRHSGALGDLQ
jgi:hypothetical protein